MSRRSIRLVNTPKVSYEDKPIDLNTSSFKKRRDCNDLLINDDNKKYKKIKLKHTVITDDDETILDNIDKSIYDETTDNESILNDESKDNDQFESVHKRLEILKENCSNNSHEKLNENQNDTSNSLTFNFSSNSKRFAHKDSINLVDEHGFLIIQNETDTSLNSNLSENQNILDVTNYDKFDDESTIEEKIESVNKVEEEEDEKPIKRIKKFVKKNKPKSFTINISNFVKHHNEDNVSKKFGEFIFVHLINFIFKSSILLTYLNFYLLVKQKPVSDVPQIIQKSVSDVPQIIQKSENLQSNSNSNEKTPESTKKTMKTSFEDFFKNQNISKSSLDEDENNQTITPKRKRGRPKKTASSTVKTEAKKPEAIIELDNDCDIVEIVNKTNDSEETPNKTNSSDKFLNNKNNSKANLFSSIDDNTIIVLDKKEEKSTSSNKSDPWTVRYKPNRADQMLDNQQASIKIKDWIHDFNSNVESSKIYYNDDDEDDLESCILITGPTGTLFNCFFKIIIEYTIEYF